MLGYRADYVKGILKSEDVKLFYNPFFDITNSITSLWFAREELGQDDMLIMNGDVFLEDRFLDVLLWNRRVRFCSQTSQEKRKPITSFFMKRGC